MSFANRVVIVTGAGSGIGEATAILFGKQKANVAIVDMNADTLKKTADQISAVGSTPLQIVADVSKDDDARRIINDTITKFGKLDVLVNNAGIGRYGTIMEGTCTKVYDQLMHVNFRAMVQLTELAAPHLIKTKGNIVNTASVGAMSVTFDPQFGIYNCSKAAVNHFTQGAAQELAPYGVRVNSVNPGSTVTNMLEVSGYPRTWEEIRPYNALGRLLAPSEIGELILYLASDKAAGITGARYLIDNGQSVGTYQGK